MIKLGFSINYLTENPTSSEERREASHRLPWLAISPADFYPWTNEFFETNDAKRTNEHCQRRKHTGSRGTIVGMRAHVLNFKSNEQESWIVRWIVPFYRNRVYGNFDKLCNISFLRTTTLFAALLHVPNPNGNYHSLVRYILLCYDCPFTWCYIYPRFF